MNADSINVQVLHTVIAIVETGSFAAAGRRLGYTTSAISQQVAQVERQLGVRLFERGNRYPTPTTAGRAFAEHARRIVAQVREAERDLRSYARGARGLVRMSTSGSISIQLLPRALARVRSERPEVEFVVEDYVSTPVAIQRVCDHSLDVALIEEYEPIPVLIPSELSATPIVQEDLVVIRSAKNQSAYAPDNVRLEDFAEEPWLTAHEGTAHAQSVAALCAARGFSPRVVFHSNNFDVLRGFVREELGIALVPALALGTDRDIAVHRLAGTPPHRTIYALRRAEDANPAADAVTAAFESAADEFLARRSMDFSYASPPRA